MDMLEILRHVERDGVDDVAGGIVLQLKFDMLQGLAH